MSTVRWADLCDDESNEEHRSFFDELDVRLLDESNDAPPAKVVQTAFTLPAASLKAKASMLQSYGLDDSNDGINKTMKSVAIKPKKVSSTQLSFSGMFPPATPSVALHHKPTPSTIAGPTVSSRQDPTRLQPKKEYVSKTRTYGLKRSFCDVVSGKAHAHSDTASRPSKSAAKENSTKDPTRLVFLHPQDVEVDMSEEEKRVKRALRFGTVEAAEPVGVEESSLMASSPADKANQRQTATKQSKVERSPSRGVRSPPGSATSSRRRRHEENQGIETDPTRLRQRQKQIDYGKRTVGYEQYRNNVPKWGRIRGNSRYPSTPDKYSVCSKRLWDATVRRWRRGLHQYDPPGYEVASEKASDGENMEEDQTEVDQSAAGQGSLPPTSC